MANTEDEQTEGAELSDEPDPHYRQSDLQDSPVQTIPGAMQSPQSTLTQTHHEPDEVINVADKPPQSSNNSNNFTSASLNQTPRQ